MQSGLYHIFHLQVSSHLGFEMNAFRTHQDPIELSILRSSNIRTVSETRDIVLHLLLRHGAVCNESCVSLSHYTYHNCLGILRIILVD